MTGPIARIILRYVAAALVTYGLVDENTGRMISGDADLLAVIQVALGAGIVIVTEGYYWAAKRYDWAT